MATTDYKLGWDYYAKFTELKWPNYRYIHLPVNSTFALPSDFRMATFNIFSGPKYVTDNFTVSGYDMSVTGEQQLTISYACPNGQVLTSTDVKLIVFGTSTWKTVWSGNTTVQYKYDITYDRFVVDGIEYEKNKGPYICPVNSDTFEKYIGRDYTRKLRITCSVDGNDYTLYIGNTKKTHSSNVLQSYEFDFNYKIQHERPAGAGGTYYDNVYKTIAVNKYHKDDGNRIIVGHIDDYGMYNNNVLTYSLMHFYSYWDGPHGSNLHSSYLDGQNITITKIEVQE